MRKTNTDHPGRCTLRWSALFSSNVRRLRCSGGVNLVKLLTANDVSVRDPTTTGIIIIAITSSLLVVLWLISTAAGDGRRRKSGRAVRSLLL